MTYRVLDDDDYDWGDDDAWDDDWREWETACVDCGKPGIDCCQCCGGYLCGMHSEIGCGFCNACPTQEWIDEQDVLRKLDGYVQPPVHQVAGSDDDIPF